MESASSLIEHEVLVFEVDGQRFAISGAVVRELARSVHITRLPKAPAIIEGVIDVRGRVVPVLDLRSRFRLRPKTPEPDDHLIIAMAGPRVVALRADRALELISLTAAEVEDLAGLVSGTDYVAGVAKLRDGLVLIHDLATFLNRAEVEALEKSLASPTRRRRKPA